MSLLRIASVQFIFLFLCVLLFSRPVIAQQSSKISSIHAFRKRLVLTNDHACLIAKNGKVYCWGSGAPKSAKSSKTRFKKISLGLWAACGIKIDNTIDCWATSGVMPTEKNFFEFRDEYRSIPWKGKFQSVALGDIHACAILTNGRIKCWKRSDVIVADSSCEPDPIFETEEDITNSCCKNGKLDCQETKAPSGSFLAVVVGEYFSCGLNKNHSIKCWGDNQKGQSSPPPGKFIKLSAGYEHACAILTNGKIVCWGETKGSNPPAGIYKDIAAGVGYSCAINQNDELVCWGRIEAEPENEPPTKAWDWSQLKIAEKFQTVTAAAQIACAVQKNGRVFCFGPNGTHEAPFNNFTQVSVSNDRACGVQPDLSVLCWGHTPEKHKDMSNYTERNKDSLPDEFFKQLSLNESFGCGVTLEGIIRCWGFGGSLASDNCQFTDAPKRCKPFPEHLGPWSQVIAASHQTCGLAKTGQIACWRSDERHGMDCSGQDYGLAQPPKGTFKQVANGDVHFCAINTNDEVVCWGGGTKPQDDDFYTENINAPPGRFTQIDARSICFCGVQTDGRLSCWGRAQDWHTPKGSFVQVSVGVNHACAIRADGLIVCWGADKLAKLVPPAGQYVEVASHYEYNCALRVDGKVKCWGETKYDKLSPPLGIKWK
ncbi:MAG: hypothetical protein JW841_07795 [Deltaproteobacteria bacterium]|nr:hypothetical protein [Deltaproteobacteria bacterium]